MIAPFGCETWVFIQSDKLRKHDAVLGKLCSGGAVQAVDLSELVVDASNEKRCCPLSDEECHVGSLCCLETNRYGHRERKLLDIFSRATAQ